MSGMPAAAAATRITLTPLIQLHSSISVAPGSQWQTQRYNKTATAPSAHQRLRSFTREAASLRDRVHVLSSTETRHVYFFMESNSPFSHGMDPSFSHSLSQFEHTEQ